eukprot:TRINITY_DN5825_c0_g1_i1.p1 TRINITY_DN5825_c0_g1~~TRINITY_DN5825_c0_g1_i1.p1  ORF type:complete len:357 (-),score=55.15 TRINITY_DN5825_c0_g1_i1:41-1009(-)
MRASLFLSLCAAAVLLLQVTAIEYDCEAIRLVPNTNYEEVYNFTQWKGANKVVVSSNYSVGIMDSLYQGDWTFEVSFCNEVSTYMGNLQLEDPQGLFGYSMGGYYHTTAVDHEAHGPAPSPTTTGIAPSHVPSSHDHDVTLEFIQRYTPGDNGAPCFNKSRSAEVHIWCAESATNCTGIPGAAENALCFDGDLTQDSFCTCGITHECPASQPNCNVECNGLEIHILSNSCPKSETRTHSNPIDHPPHAPPPANVAAGGWAAFFIILAIVAVFVASIFYNRQVLGKTGLAMLPLYETCTGKGGNASYEKENASFANTEGYGSL